MTVSKTIPKFSLTVLFTCHAKTAFGVAVFNLYTTFLPAASDVKTTAVSLVLTGTTKLPLLST